MVTKPLPDTAADVKQRIREFVWKTLAPRMAASGAASDELSLVESGSIDSLSVFRLVSFLEENFGVLIADDEIRLDKFRTINAIGDLVIAKRSKPEA